MPPTPATHHTASDEAQAPRRRRTDVPDAVAQLTDDHRAMLRLFKDYDRLVKHGAGADERARLAARIGGELELHMQLEEELLYPACRERMNENELVDEAVVEHESARELIRQIDGMHPDEALYDAKVKVLGEYIEHHAREEEDELFPKVRRRLDTEALGEQMHERRAQLALAERHAQLAG
ncbi:hemerythrin domain-containing protein [Ideonella sp.]|uniref:hemerythrin domain-containing protein n=1 Tax=Ideonella sp. TaxID=1929293 RepID=UPI0035B34796